MSLETSTNYERQYPVDLARGAEIALRQQANVGSMMSAEPDILVMAKPYGGFSSEQALQFRTAIDTVLAQKDKAIKYIVLDLCGGMAPAQAGHDQFDKLADSIETLVQRSSIITVVCARGAISGPDLALALAANMLVADERATFLFDTEPTEALVLYGLLARKIGFAPAERLMDQEQVLTTQQMINLFLVRESFDLSGGMDPFWTFMKKSRRRYNSACAIYRAQSIAAPSVYRALSGEI